jgi:magnesium-transporting ATPase (P-type)
MNMATSASLSVVAFEAAERNIMKRPPRLTGQHVMDAFAVWRVAFVGTMIAIAAFALEAWLAPRGHSAEFTRTVLLQMLVCAQWVYMINCRNADGFSLHRPAGEQRYLAGDGRTVTAATGDYLPAVYADAVDEALPLRYWAITLIAGEFFIVEIEKRLTQVPQGCIFALTLALSHRERELTALSLWEMTGWGEHI